MSESFAAVCTVDLPTGDTVDIIRRRFGAGEPKIVIIAGIRGDTPEGIRVAQVVTRHVRAQAARLQGTIDIFPCVNPMAAHQGARHWPGLDVDLNRRFPGRVDGHAPDQVAHALLTEVADAAQVLELRGAHPAFREEPHAMVRVDRPVALRRAMRANVRAVWQRQADPEESGTFAAFVPDLIRLEGGSGNRLTEGVGAELSDGVLNLLAEMGIFPEDALPFHWAGIQRPRAVTDAEVLRVRADRGGLYLPIGKIGATVAAGEAIGEVVEPTTGETLEVVGAPADGWILAMREQPVVYPGSLVARLVVE